MISYRVVFIIAGLLFEQYLIHIKGPSVPILLLEQSIIPFFFGFYVYKLLKFKGKFSPFLVVFMPLSIVVVNTVLEIISNEKLTILELPFLFVVVMILQLMFVTIGAYVEYFKNIKVHS